MQEALTIEQAAEGEQLLLLSSTEREALERWLMDNAESLLAGARELAELKGALCWIGERAPMASDCRSLVAARHGRIREYARSLGWPGP